MTNEERALLAAGLTMEYPSIRVADINLIVDDAADAVAVVLPDVPLARVEKLARAQLEARALSE